MGFRVVNGKYVDIKTTPGHSITGIYRARKDIVTSVGPQVVWELEDIQGVDTSEGAVSGIYGFTNLNRAMKDIPFGTLVRITYAGVKKGVKTRFGLKDVHQVVVEVDENSARVAEKAVGLEREQAAQEGKENPPPDEEVPEVDF